MNYISLILISQTQTFIYNKTNKQYQSRIMQPLYDPNRRHSLTIASSINQRGSPIKKRICAQYLPKYYKKLRLSNKRVLDPSEDRLSQLTTKQIDRLIEMQKIKSLLNDNKKSIRPTHINFTEDKNSNRHPHVYQPNFLAKINRIAVERNIRHLKSEQFDEAELSAQQIRERGLQLQKKNLRFLKQYRVDNKKQTILSYEEKQQKSISSIEDCLQQFQKTLQERKSMGKNELMKQRQIKLNRYKYKKSNILSMTRWFNGMSTHYLNLDKGNDQKMRNSINKTITEKPEETRPSFDRNYDFEYETNENFSNFNHKRYKTSDNFYNRKMNTVV